jgi:hypothetical protein
MAAPLASDPPLMAPAATDTVVADEDDYATP